MPSNAMETRRSTVRASSGVNVVLGVWLIAAPFVLAYSEVRAAMWNDVIVGVVILALAGYRVAQPAQSAGLSWVNVVLGIWLIAAPFALGYGDTTAAMWNDVIVGIAVAVLGAVSAMTGAKLRGAMQKPA